MLPCSEGSSPLASRCVVIVVASSGFGKTSLLEQWAITTGAQVTWLS